MENNLNFINLALALFGGCICICRMGMMAGKIVKQTIRWQYVAWFVALVISVLYGSPVTFGHLVLTAGLVFYLLTGFGAWRHGMPWYAVRGQ